MARVKKASTSATTKASKPTPPAYLDKASRAEYVALTKTLDVEGKLATCDPKLIELYAINYALLIRAVEEIATQPLVSTNEQGRQFVNPLIGVIHNSTQKVRQVIADLGLSPASAKMVGENMPPMEAASRWSDLVE